VNGEPGALPAPFVLDASVLIEVARGETGLMSLIQGWDATGQPLIVPALAITAASLDMRSPDAEDLLHGLELLESTMVAPLRDTDQATRLGAVIARTGLDPWDAHVAAVADTSVCPIATVDAAKWREHARSLDEPLHYIEITDPDDKD
jgi:predicted nucleic acid-binding protein